MRRDMALLRLDDVHKTYPGPVTAVRGITLDVADGEFVVLVGPSGCGKSSILRMVAGLETVTSGSVTIGDRVVDDLPPRDRNVAMVFQNYALYPHMTVRSNITFGLKMRKVPAAEIKRRLDEAARLLGLAGVLDRKPAALSGGQQQRVAVGRAIVRQPDCFLFDEPLSNLDARMRIQTRGELKTLHRRLRTTTLYVTHDQEEAMTLGDRVVVLCDGEVQQVGPPLEIYRRPVNRFVAEFVGSPPINLIPGHVGDGGFDDGQGWQVPVTTRHRGAAVLGVRPEVLERATNSDAAITITVEVCEPVGERMDVHGRTEGGTKLVARVDADDSVADGQKLPLRIGGVHVFEPGPFGRTLESD
jgi:ABC-type sugar transport system ATPase subunit